MAEILIRIVNNTNSDPVKDAWCYKAGDPVLVMPDNWVWGRCESKAQWIADGNTAASWPGGFAIIKVPGAPVSDFAAHVAPGVARRRDYRIDIASAVAALTQAMRTQYQQTGSITITKAQLLNYIAAKG